MQRALLIGTLLLLGVVSSALAWNKAGHMVSGAIAYADLKQVSPQTLARVVALLNPTATLVEHGLLSQRFMGV